MNAFTISEFAGTAKLAGAPAPSEAPHQQAVR
jgi:hypothetical protein